MVAGGNEMHRQTNTWWGRNMVCLSADQFAENHLESNGVDVKRLKLEGTKWNFDVEMDSGIPGPPLEPSRRGNADSNGTDGNSYSTSTSTSRPEEHVFEMQARSNRGGGDVATKTGMVIYDPSYMNPAKSKVIGKVVRYTSILEALIPKLQREDDKLIDTGQIIIAQKLQVLNNDINATMVSW